METYKMDDIFKSKDDNDIGTKYIFNIRGSKFQACEKTLQKVPCLILNNKELLHHFYDREYGEYYFDRDPEVFNSILNMCIHGKFHIPRNTCVNLVRKEMDFWGVPKSLVAVCCWRTFFQLDEELMVTEELRKSHQQFNDDTRALKPGTLRLKIWLCIEKPQSSLTAKIWNSFYMAVVLLSTILLCMWTRDEFRTEHYLTPVNWDTTEVFGNDSITNWERFMLSDPILPVFILDTFCTVVFTVEFVVHFWSSPFKIAFLRRSINVLTVCVITILWTTFLLEFDKEGLTYNRSARHFYFACKAFTMGRLLLFLKLEIQFRALRVLLRSIRASMQELLLMILTFAISSLIFGSLLFFIQIQHKQGVDDILIWTWWAIVTMTTVGYGDYFPTSPLGYLVGILCAMCGVVLLALPIAVISSNFAAYYSMSKDHNAMAKLLRLAEMEKVEKLKETDIGDKNNCQQMKIKDTNVQLETTETIDEKIKETVQEGNKI